MTDIELTEKIKNLRWDIDLSAKTCKSELVHYEIKKGKEYTDLQMYWIHPDIPPAMSAINEIQRSAADAVLESMNNE
jgi:hypothetical protein